jgi:predicted DNA-binding transcriptional regulator YafY
VALIQRAMLERRRLDMRHYSMSRDEENRRQVDPYHLTVFDGGYYLVGYCHWRKTERIFAVERVRELRILATRFTVRPGFDVEEYLKQSWGIVKGEIVPVKVIFSRAVGRYIRERLWHQSQRLRGLPDGRLEMTMRVPDTLELRRWLLGYAAEAEVLEPPRLRETLRSETERLVTKLGATRKPPREVQPRYRSSRRLGHAEQ